MALSEICGLSVAFLSQIENQRTLPSERSIAAIAAAFGTTVKALQELARARGTVRVLKASPAHARGVRELVNGGPASAVEFRGVRGDTEQSAVANGDQLLYVIAGSLKVIAGGSSKTLNVGDSLHSAEGSAISWRVVSDAATALLVIGRT